MVVFLVRFISKPSDQHAMKEASTRLLQVVSPNVKAAERTQSKPDEQLHRHITPCGCLFEQRGVPHVRCYYSYDNGWLFESRLLNYAKRQIAEYSKRFDRIDAEIRDLRLKRTQAVTRAQILEINGELAKLHRQKAPFMPALYKLQDELEQAAFELGRLELQLNGILPFFTSDV
jgi:hypothetical protein